MPEGSRRKRRKSSLLFSSKKQLQKLKMLRRLQKFNGIEISSIVRTLSYEDHGVETGHIEFGNNLVQNSEGTETIELDSVEEYDEGRQQSSAFESEMFLRSSKLVSPTIYCRK